MLSKRLYRSDMINCALCHDAPCSSACGRLDPSSLLRSVWFENEDTAAGILPDENPCAGCSAPCEDACVRPRQVPIRKLITRLYEEVKPDLEVAMPEDEERLRTQMCGIPMENPFLLSSSVVASTYDMCARAFEAGWAGAAFKTICSLEIHEASPRYSAINGDNGTIIGFKNVEQLSDHSVEEQTIRLNSYWRPSWVRMTRTGNAWRVCARRTEPTRSSSISPALIWRKEG